MRVKSLYETFDLLISLLIGQRDHCYKKPIILTCNKGFKHMQPIINQPRPAVPQGPRPEAREETIGEACAKRAYGECCTNIICGGALGMLYGNLVPVYWHGIVVSSALTGMTVGACLSHKSTHTLCKRLCERPLMALRDSCERGSLCPPCPRLNTASSQSDEAPVRNI